MKKIVSLILVLILICFTASGCLWEDIIKQITSTTINPEYEGIVWEEKIYWEGDVNANFVPGELIVVMDKAISEPNKVHDPEFFIGVEVVRIIDMSFSKIPEGSQFNQILMLILSEKYNTKEATFEALCILESIVGIRSVSANLIMTPLLSPNDLYYSFSEGDEDQWAIDNINAPLVWNFTTGSELINVGVVDSGIASHIDLDDNYDISDAWNFYDSDGLSPLQYLKTDSDSHGTHVAGIMKLEL